MTAFHYIHQSLHCEAVPVAPIVEAVGAPVYIYSLDEIERQYAAYAEAFPQALIAYAYKANASLALCNWLHRLGAGADVVSGGELRVAQAAGVAGAKTVFNGNGKSDAEIEVALRGAVLSINADAVEELDRIAAIADRLDVIAPVSIRINPGVDPHTHRHIATGVTSSQFGVPLAEAAAAYDHLARFPSLRAVGIHAHIGSQITRLGPFVEAVDRLVDLATGLLARGFPLKLLDIGGGLGIDYHRWDDLTPLPPSLGGKGESDAPILGGKGESDAPILGGKGESDAPILGEEGTGEKSTPLTPADLARALRLRIADLGLSLVLEPGRSLVAPAGILITQVLHRKHGHDVQRIVVDTGMNTLIRPALYEAYHAILPVRAGTGALEADVVGPNCESSDVVGRSRALPAVRSGDLLAIMDAGAYGYSLSSNYNNRPRPAEVVVKGNEWRTVRPAQSWDELLVGQVTIP